MTLKPLCFASNGGTIGLGGTKDTLLTQVKALVEEAKDTEGQIASERVPAGVCLASLDEDCLRSFASEGRAVRTPQGNCVVCSRFQPLPALGKASDGDGRFAVMHFLTNGRKDGSLRVNELVTA